jgi:hypothetical protein
VILLTIQKILILLFGAILVLFGCGRAGYGISTDGEVGGEDSGIETDYNADTDTYTDTDTDINTDAGADTDAGTDADTDTDAGTDADTDTDTDTEDEDLPAGPVVTSVELEGGAATTERNTVSLVVTVQDGLPPIEVRVANAHPATDDCQGEYADDGWQAYADPEGIYPVSLAVVPGTKKVCAWAKDSLGQVSLIEPSTGTLGVDMDTIEYETGTPPMITRFEVTNDTAGLNLGTHTYQPGDQVRIEWTISDVEGLADNPVDLYYTTNGESWTPILESHGGLVGNPSDYVDSYTGFVAPGSDFFRLKLVAKDMAGNTGIPALSNSQNTADWSIYAGSADTGVGGTGLGMALSTSMADYTIRFDVDPTTNDLYALSTTELVRIDARTGIVSRVMTVGTNNLPEEGSLPAEPELDPITQLRFDSHGLLYLFTMPNHNHNDVDLKLFQIDLQARSVRSYLGGGMLFDDSATPETVSFFPGPFAFDEDDSLYFYTSCNPGAITTARLMKATQNSDHSAGTVSVVAGNCVAGDPASPGPVDALTSPVYSGGGFCNGSLAVWDHGNVIYYHTISFSRKIINGQSYSADTRGYGLYYNRHNGKLYGADGLIREYTPNLSGPDGDTAVVFAERNGATPDCIYDGVDAGSACVVSHLNMTTTTQGRLLFNDGTFRGAYREYRIRYKDDHGRLQTYVGGLPFHGDGFDKGLMRGPIAGIYYKHDFAPNQTPFPAGLYYLVPSGPVFGYIDPTIGIATTLWGNQDEGYGYPATGTVIGPELSMGLSNGIGGGSALTFDDNGLPWLRRVHHVVSIDANRQVVNRQDGTAFWFDAIDGENPKDFRLYWRGGWQNFTLKDQGLFFIGSDYSPKVIQYFDFGAQTTTKLMGNDPDGVSPDNATPGSVKDLSLSRSCYADGACHIQYRADEDRLYFGEEDRVRYITTPTDTSTATLGTLFVLPGGGEVENFIFSPEHSQLFYLSGGELYCHDISSGRGWCDDSVLGPPAGLARIARGPNQLTWQDDGHLLISNYQGEIYEYTLPLEEQRYDCSIDQVEIPVIECEALKALYIGTWGPGWNQADDWLLTAFPCSWYGVTCQFSSVTGLELTSNNLSGSIPAELANLSNLVHLAISYNNLSGTIPSWLGNLQFLETLDLRYNQFSGSIPPQLGNLSNLTDLSLGNNQLNGSIPPELGNLGQLRNLNLEVNDLSGSIPAELGSLSNLENIDLAHNGLEGAIPDSLAGCSQLVYIGLHYNSLTGTIPTWLGNLQFLNILDLRYNQFSGSIPPEFGNLTLLENLYLSNNQLSGNLPDSLMNLTQLVSLSLSGNLCFTASPSLTTWLDAQDPDWADGC